MDKKLTAKIEQMRYLEQESPNFQTDSNIQPMNIANLLIKWYDQDKRSLPWRETSNPYHIWISEIILQQTQVKQGIEYYLRFIDTFPNIERLSSAKIQEVMQLWQGLGYYVRGRNLHEAAKQIMVHHGGVYPNKYREILSLKGVGPYTAAAVASIAFSLPYAVVDGNVFRVLSRLMADDTNIATGKGKRHFQRIADRLLNLDRPGDHNQAMMELGATVCKPVNPDCAHCCLRCSCQAFESHTASHFPVRMKRPPVKNRYFVFLVLNHRSSLLMGRREEKDIWQFLYQFPLIECNKRKFNSENIRDFVIEHGRDLLPSDGYVIGDISKSFLHRLTHRLIHARFIDIHCQKKTSHISGYRFFSPSERDRIPVPRLISRYFEEERRPV